MNWVKTKKGYSAVELQGEAVVVHFTKNPKNLNWAAKWFYFKTKEGAKAAFEKTLELLEKEKVA